MILGAVDFLGTFPSRKTNPLLPVLPELPISHSQPTLPHKRLLMEPISYSPAVLSLIERCRDAAQRPATATANPIDPDDAAALVLSLLADPSGRIVPAEAYEILAARNQAIIDAPETEVKSVLARQVTVLEAVMLRYMAAAAAESSPKRAEPLARIGLSAQRALIATLGAVHTVAQAGGAPHA